MSAAKIAKVEAKLAANLKALDGAMLDGLFKPHELKEQISERYSLLHKLKKLQELADVDDSKAATSTEARELLDKLIARVAKSAPSAPEQGLNAEGKAVAQEAIRDAPTAKPKKIKPRPAKPRKDKPAPVDKSYKFRAECQHDVDEFKALLDEVDQKRLVIIPDSMGLPDVDCDLQSHLSLHELRELMGQVVDSHVMVESLNYAADYTGDRWFQDW